MVIRYFLYLGIPILLFNFFVDFLSGDVQIKSIVPMGREYEVELINNSPTDQIIEKFRILPNNMFLYEITETIEAKVTEDGTIILPFGNDTIIPAMEYKSMDGYKFTSKSAQKFLIPPLVSKEYMSPSYMDVQIYYETRSQNFFLNIIENIFVFTHLKNRQHNLRYNVINNHWTPVSNDNQENVIKNACRDNDKLSNFNICKDNR